MEHPIEILKKEHRVIEKVLIALASFAQELEGKGDDTRSTVIQFTDFFRNFADRCHHGKEEDLLFKELEKHGLPSQAGPLAVMRNEHERGRRCVREMASVAERTGPLTAEEQSRLRNAISEFVPLLQNHIQKEDGVLFPMAENVLGPESADNLQAQFERFEREHMGKGVHEKMHDLAISLVNRYPVR